MQHLNERDGKVTMIMEETHENWVAMNQMLGYAFSFRTKADPESKPEAYQRNDPHTRITTYDKDGAMVAGLQVLWEDICIKGRPIGHGGIKAVASVPWARRQGNVGMTLVGACRLMREKGVPVSSLYPFSFAFYRKYGWELGQRSTMYRVPMHELAPFAKAPGGMERIGPLPEGSTETDTAFERLKALYGGFARTVGAAFVRSPGWWRHVTLEGLNENVFTCIYVAEDGADEGYITYTLNRDRRELYAKELVHRTPRALEGILGFVYAHDSMVGTFAWKAPLNTDLQLLLGNPRVPESGSEPGMMFRVIDVLPTLGHCAMDYTGPAFALRVKDPQLEWNNGLFLVSPGNAERVSDVDSGTDTACILDMDINRLSQAVCGYVALGTLAKAGLIGVTGAYEPVLDSLFIPGPGYVPYMNDNF